MRFQEGKYRRLFEYIKNDDPKASLLLQTFIPEITEFIIRAYNVPRENAPDYVSNALFSCIKLLFDDKLDNDCNPSKYVFTSARNGYFADKKKKREYCEFTDYDTGEPPEQIEHIQRAENMRILPKLINRLGANPKAAILHYLENPTADYKDAAKATGMSVSNIRTAKSRAIRTLNEYYNQIEQYGT